MTTHERIIADSLTIFFRTGIKAVTMDDIARELGMSKKTIYQYVENKEDLINQVMQKFLSKDQERIQELHEVANNAIEEMVLIAQYVIQQLRHLSPVAVYDLQKYYRTSFQHLEDFHNECVFVQIKDNIIWGQEDGLYREDVNPAIIAKVYIQMSELITNKNIFPLREHSFDQIFRQFLKYHMQGLVSAKGQKIFQKYLTKSYADVSL